MDKETLISIIETAFDGVEQPSSLTLHVAEAYDDYDYDHDIEHRRKDFIGRWQEIPREHLEKCQAALSYVEQVGMRYYLPAFMVWYLENLETYVPTDNTLYALHDNRTDKTSHEYHKERFSLFNTEQLNTSAKFVKYCAYDALDHSDAHVAKKLYERYWHKYEQI